MSAPGPDREAALRTLAPRIRRLEADLGKIAGILWVEQEDRLSDAMRAVKITISSLAAQLEDRFDDESDKA